MDANQLNGIIQNPALTIGAGLLGISAALKEVREWWTAAWGYITSKQGQAVVKDVTTLNADVQAILTDAGVDKTHPALKQVETAINAALAALPKAVAVLLLMLLPLMASAASLNLGPVPVSPAAGSCVIVVSPILGATFWHAGAGVTLDPENDVIGGVQGCATWGAYGLGVAVAIDQDVTDNQTYGAAGVVGEFLPFGEAFALWRQSGCLLGITFPFGAGASVQP